MQHIQTKQFLCSFHDKTTAYLWRNVLQTLQGILTDFLPAIHIISLGSKRDGYSMVFPQALF